DRVTDEHVLDEIGGHALVADVEHQGGHREAPVAALRGFDRAAERPLGIRPRHPFSQQADIGRRRDITSGVGPAAEVDVLGQRRDHVFGTQPRWDGARVAQVEPRAAAQPLLGDPLPLDLLDALPLHRDTPVFSLAPRADLVQLALQPAPAIAIVFLLDALLEVLFALALVGEW